MEPDLEHGDDEGHRRQSERPPTGAGGHFVHLLALFGEPLVVPLGDEIVGALQLVLDQGVLFLETERPRLEPEDLGPLGL